MVQSLGSTYRSASPTGSTVRGFPIPLWLRIDVRLDEQRTMSSTQLARDERVALCDLLDEVGPDAPTLCADWTPANTPS